MLKPAEGVVAQEDRGELFLLHLESGRYFGLNRTGLLVWEAIAAGDDPLAAVQRRHPAVPAGQLSGDVAAVVDQLVAARLVVDDTR